MDVKGDSRALILLACVAMGQPLWSQSTHSKYDPAGAQHVIHSKPGFLDFTLSRINPPDRDYGQAIATERDRIRSATIQEGYFWSNISALSLLGVMFLIVSYQQQRLNRAARGSIEIVAQYEHALRRANAEIEEGSLRNRDLINSLIKLKETAISPASDRNGVSEATLQREKRKQQTDTIPFVPDSPRTKPAKSAKNGVLGSNGATTATADQIGLFKSEVDFMVKINSLEQQLSKSRDVETELRRQLNESSRRVQAEQDKNRTLKGG